MCRNITVLRGLEPPATPEEVEAAARQYVRKVGGVQAPSPATAEASSGPCGRDRGHRRTAGRTAGPAAAADHGAAATPSGATGLNGEPNRIGDVERR